jgi:hypothetical protein
MSRVVQKFEDYDDSDDGGSISSGSSENSKVKSDCTSDSDYEEEMFFCACGSVFKNKEANFKRHFHTKRHQNHLKDELEEIKDDLKNAVLIED